MWQIGKSGRGVAGLTVVIIVVFFFLLGTIVGSFLNVCITRIPEEISIVTPGSRCPQCKTPIKPYDNVPVFAWLWLRGKCRACGTPISPMYPLIELTAGLLFVAAFFEFGVTQATVKWLFFTCLVIVLTVTDLRVRLLPDVVNWPGFAAGLLFSAFVPPNDELVRFFAWRSLHVRLPGFAVGILDGLLGAAFGSFLLWGLAKAYKVVRGREGMGMGDVKMIAMIGAFLGLRGTFLTLLVGSLLGSLIGIGLVGALYLGGWRSELAKRASRRGLGTEKRLRWAIARQYHLPLGTFLGIGALAIVYGGPVVAAQWTIFRGLLG
ncbi:MAG TPA: prepilin peptidase [Candidatus Acidoferrum sp.]|nr:prepilin peptidase [Candidatus Acidoferrum sp.]